MKDFANSTYLSNFTPDGQWIQIFPAGTWYGYDGRGPYRLSNPQTVIDNSLRPKTDLVIDRDHKRFFDPKAEVKAAGWFKKFEIRNGEIWGYVEWVPAAKKELAEKEYRYFSPEYDVNPETREMVRITGGSLTNKPNFELDAVASAQPHRNQNPISKETKMDEHIKALAKKLGLPETASTEDVLKACEERFAEAAAVEQQAASLITDFKVEKLEDVAKAATELREAAAAQTGKVDPEKYVPIDAHNEVASQLKELKEGITKDKAEAVVEAAMKEGKIAPAQKDWAMDYASQNLEGFQTYLKGTPKIVDPNSEAASGKPKTEGGLTEEEAEVASQLGLSAEEYLGEAADSKKEGKEAA